MCELDFGFGAVCQKGHENDHRLWVFGMKYSAPPVSFPGLLCFCSLQPSHPSQVICAYRKERKKEGRKER